MQRWSSNYPSQRNRRHARREAKLTIQRDNIFPTDLPKRVVGGHVLYAPVVSVVPGRLVLLSGLLARNSAGEIVGKGDMRAQIRQVGENMKVADLSSHVTLADDLACAIA